MSSTTSFWADERGRMAFTSKHCDLFDPKEAIELRDWITATLDEHPPFPAWSDSKPNRVVLGNSEIHMILLALAELALSRPGFSDAIQAIAESLGGESGREQWLNFKHLRRDVIKPSGDYGPYLDHEDGAGDDD